MICTMRARWEMQPHREPCSRFSLTTTSFAMSLHWGILASLTTEQVLLSTMVPMGRVIALASVMPWEDPDASTTKSNPCTPPACTIQRHFP